MLGALNVLGSALLRGLENRTGPLSGDTRFRGLSRDEVGTTLEEMRAEVDAQTTMMLMASFEAELMVFYRRGSWKGHKPLGRMLKKLWREPQPSLKKLLTKLREFAADKKSVSQFIQAIPDRHWLAHGRYFESRSGIGSVTPEMGWRLGADLFETLPVVASLPGM